MIILHKDFSYINAKFNKDSKKNFEYKGEIFFITEEDKDIFIEKLIHGLKNSKVIAFLPKPLSECDVNHDFLEKIDLSISTNNEVVTTHFILFTSGTTGKPKQILHTINSLTSKIKKRDENFIWGLTYDPFRMAGLQVILSAITNGDKLVIPGVLDITKNLEFFIEHKVNTISATPSYFRILLSSEKAQKLNLKQITIGGEIVGQKLLDSLKSLYPESRITHIYASTEIGAAFSVNDLKEGFPTSFLNNPKHSTGKLDIIDNELCFKNENKIFRSGDMVEVNQDRVIFIGRKDSIVNIGGNKISLDKVEQVLLNLDFIKHAICTPINHPILNNVVKSEISLSDLMLKDEIEIKKIIRKECMKKLPKYAIPTKIEIVDNIKLSSNSKIKRTL